MRFKNKVSAIAFRLAIVGMFVALTGFALGPQNLEAKAISATLNLQGSRLQTMTFPQLEVSFDTYRVGGDGSYEKNDTAGSDTSKVEESLRLDATLKPETYDISGNFSGKGLFDVHYANDRPGEENKAKFSYSGTLKGAATNGSTWSGTYSITYTSSTKTGSVGAPPETGTTLTGPFTLNIRDNNTRIPGADARQIAQRGYVADISGDDVEISRDGGKTFSKLRKGSFLGEGDIVSTGYGESAVIDFGHGTLNVPALTQVRLDEFTNKDNLERTQLYLLTGAVKATLDLPDSIRGDFSVTSPTNISSIRGSSMLVVYDEDTKTSEVYALEGKTYVKRNGETEKTLEEGSKVSADESGIGVAATFEISETEEVLKGASKKSGNYLWWGIGIFILAAIFGIYKKMKTGQGQI